MRLVRIVIAIAACVAVALVLQRHVAPRYRCSVEKKRSDLWLLTAADSAPSERQMAIARGAVPRLGACVDQDPSDYEALYLLAVARNLAGQKEAAQRHIEAALALNERPEFYLTLGVMQLESGDAEAARANLLKAAYFNLHLLEDAVSPTLADEISVAVQQRRKRLLASKGITAD